MVTLMVCVKEPKLMIPKNFMTYYGGVSSLQTEIKVKYKLKYLVSMCYCCPDHSTGTCRNIVQCLSSSRESLYNTEIPSWPLCILVLMPVNSQTPLQLTMELL